MRRIKKLLRKISFLETIEDYSVKKRREMWPPVPELKEEHIKNCRLIVNRNELLNHVPTGGVCAEIGIDQCIYSERILNVTKPKQFHLFDIDPKAIAIGAKKFEPLINKEAVVLHEGDSSKMIAQMPDDFFDWVYVDGLHTYEGCKNDLEVVRTKMKDNGLILINDYVYFAPSDFWKYGVIEATNEFCLKYGYEMIYMALQGRSYNDVVIRKIK